MSATPTNVGGTGKWQPQLHGLIHEKARVAIEWMTQTLLKLRSDTQAVNENVVYSTNAGIGTGAATAMQAPAQGKGGGPASLTAATWLEITIPSGPLKGQKGHIALFQ